MDDREQIKAFADDLDNLVNRYADEFDMTYAAVVGVLCMKINIMCHESKDAEEEGE